LRPFGAISSIGVHSDEVHLGTPIDL
jgi:hypothetical protein